MIGVTDLRKGSAFEIDGQPYLVLKYNHAVLGRKKARVKLTVRNLKTGRVNEKTFLGNKKLALIELENRFLLFRYFDGREYHFQEPKTSQDFEISQEILGEEGSFLKKDQKTKALFWEGQPLAVELPPSINLKVKKAAPGVKGDTTTNIYKPAVLENGLKIKVPLFIKPGDIIKVDTRSGEYAARV